MSDLPSYRSAPAAVMATDQSVRRTDKYRKPATYRKARKAYRAPARKPANRRYKYSRKANNAIQIDLPECSQHYIKALYDPWVVPAGVCIPCDLFPLPSQKLVVKKRFTITLSTNGCGWALFSGSLASDISAGSYTTTGSVGGTTAAFTAGASWTTASVLMDTLPYTNADIVTDKTVQGRLVAMGVRARYVGLEDKRGGVYVGVEESDHQDIVQGTPFNTIDKLKSIPNAYITSPRGDGNWDISVCYSGPVQPSEIEFDSDAYPCGPGAGVGTTFMGIAFAGTSDMAGQLIDVEFIQHVEFVGRKVPGKTPSHADSKTYGKVLETVKEQAAIQPIEPSNFLSGFSQFVSKVADAAPKLISLGMGAIQTAATGNPLPMLAAGAQMFMPSTQANERLMIKG